LAQAGISPDAIDPVDLDESALPGEIARRTTMRLAALKAKTSAARQPGSFVIGADTMVCVGGRALGKPATHEDAEKMLSLLSGRGHRVFTAVTVVASDGRTATRLAQARVRMKVLSASNVTSLLDCDEWRGAAGAYRIQGRAGVFVTRLTGSYTAVVGLPLHEAVSLLEGLGYAHP
jgi:septum formation protein